ncbi:MAG: lipoate protein ligase C-terminal domain-containing protein [Romboutsia timonensis]
MVHCYFHLKYQICSNALKVKPIKFEGKSIKSVKARVTNISEHLKVPMDILEFKDLIIDYFYKTNTDNKYYTLSELDINNINKLVEEKYNTWDWNFGHSPKYSLYNELKYPGGNVEFNLNVEGGIIKDIKFFGDFFGKCDISHIENLLLNTKHEEESLKTILNSININDYFLGADTDVLVSGIMGVK